MAAEHDAPHEMTISQILSSLGYGHRKNDGAPYGKREIFRIDTGECIGFCDAGEAIGAAMSHAASIKAEA